MRATLNLYVKKLYVFDLSASLTEVETKTQPWAGKPAGRFSSVTSATVEGESFFTFNDVQDEKDARCILWVLSNMSAETDKVPTLSVMQGDNESWVADDPADWQGEQEETAPFVKLLMAMYESDSAHTLGLISKMLEWNSPPKGSFFIRIYLTRVLPRKKINNP